MHRKLTTAVACVTAATLISASLPVTALAASLRATTESSSFDSNYFTSSEQVNVTTSGTSLTVKYRSALKGVKYRVGLRNVGTSARWYAKGDFTASNKGFTVKLNTAKQSNGTYYLVIARAANASQAQGWSYIGGAHGYAFIGVPIKITSGKPKVVKYSTIMSQNKAKRAASAKKGTSRYKSTSAKALSDISWVFNGYDAYLPSESERRSYFKAVSKSVVGKTTNPYMKMRKIYTYCAGNFYYDTLAFQNHSRQHINPYTNLKKYRRNLSSSNSQATSGKRAKVATTCIGYASMLIALARAQGIPAKLVYGHALTSPWNTWSTESNIDKRDHFWAEVYLDGRWMIMDPTRGTNAKWNRSSNTWEKKAAGKLLTYNYFDPTLTFFSNTHRIFGYDS
ncbi:MAG: transglutaminase-like domain-containing protein [Coriobacteriia bacterium]|nr:transglutaminase-like domain-containing protein [Coriobacteriia bacterium]